MEWRRKKQDEPKQPVNQSKPPFPPTTNPEINERRRGKRKSLRQRRGGEGVGKTLDACGERVGWVVGCGLWANARGYPGGNTCTIYSENVCMSGMNGRGITSSVTVQMVLS
jgi:hypothetical protein